MVSIGQRVWNGKTWLDLAAIIVLIVALLDALGDLLGTQPPFQGTTLDQLQATTGFLVAVLAVVGAGAYLVLRRAGGLSRERWQLAGVVALVLLGVLTARTAFRAAFVNYDLAIEYLVYAHGAPGVNVVMDTIDDLATRTADGAGLDVAYDDQTSYPFMWYLRNYPRVHFFGGSPTRDLLNSPVVIVGAGNWSKVEPILGKRYYAFELHRLWWPNQDYWRAGQASSRSTTANSLLPGSPRHPCRPWSTSAGPGGASAPSSPIRPCGTPCGRSGSIATSPSGRP